MKKFIKIFFLAACATLSSHAAANPFYNVPGYGQYTRTPGYVLTCPTETGDYHYWFAMGQGTRVALSRIGFPDGRQLLSRVFDGEQIPGGYDLVFRAMDGRNYRARWSGKSGVLFSGERRVECFVKKTTFIQ